MSTPTDHGSEATLHALLQAAATLHATGIQKSMAVTGAIDLLAELRKQLENGTRKAVVHGETCVKHPHYGSDLDYGHDANDDRLQEINGVTSCGRCHEALP